MLIDTSGWFCIFDEQDARHSAAATIYENTGQKITHSFVIAEFIALSEARKKHRREMLEFTHYLVTDSEVGIVWVDEGLNGEALALLRRRIDKEWSLCDAVSFILMENRNIVEALTTDHHFEQAGFVKLLES